MFLFAVLFFCFNVMSNKACLHPAAPPEVCKIGLSAVAPVLSASSSTLSPLFLSVLASLSPADRKAMLGEMDVKRVPFYYAKGVKTFSTSMALSLLVRKGR